MRPDSSIHRRRSIRLKGYDYFQAGAYFITICTHARRNFFGSLTNGKMLLNENGIIAQECWHALPDRFRRIELDAFVFMPNHIHGIIFIVAAQFIAPNNRTEVDSKLTGEGAMNHAGGTMNRAATQGGVINRTPKLGEVIRAFKAVASRKIRLSGLKEFKWQNNYYEHVIRDEDSLNKIRQYIMTNPLRWEIDRENPLKKGVDEFDRWLDTFKGRPDVTFQKTESD